LSGTVSDENGALLPAARISVLSLGQGFQRQALSNGEGTFVVPLLPPGTYLIKAEHEGFATAEVRDVVLNVNDQVRLNIVMKVGRLNGQSVDVLDTPTLIDESPNVSTTVDRQFVSNLPLNGRSFQPLITLSPGVVLTKTIVQDQGQFSVNGQRADANYFTVDGVSANIGASASTQPSQSGAGALPGLAASGGTNNLVSIDALQEFKIQTSTYAPEFGRTPGAQVSIITRAGTKEFHGTIFDYFRNDVFDANDWFANRQGLKKPALRQNDFGGVIGGPLHLPRFGEGGHTFDNSKRNFFFFSYEGLRLRQPQVGISDVPSLAARAVASPDVLPFLNLYPRPNGPTNALNLGLFSAAFSNPATLNATSLRIDSNVTSKLTVFGRYNHAPSETTGRGGVTQSLNTLTHFKARTQTLTLAATYVMTTRTINEFRFNYSRNLASSFFSLDNFGGAIVPETVFPTGRTTENSFFNVNLTGAQLGAIFLGQQNSTLQRQINVVDSMNVISGEHQFKFGLDYRRLAPVFKAPAYLQTYIFSGVGNLNSPALGTLLSGRLQLGLITSINAPRTAIFNNVSSYAQDTWRAFRHLTLTYGVRWDINPPPHAQDGEPPVVLTQINNPATFSFAPRGTPLWKTTYGNVAPRIGVSYQLSDRQGRETVVRGGFGIFYDLGNGQASNAFIAGFPFTTLKILSGVPVPLSSTDAAPPAPGPNPTSSDIIYAFDPSLELPRVYQWNFAIERSLGTAQTVTASYVAAVGRKLLRINGIPNPNATLRGNFQITTNDATSDYHSMQLQFQRRLTRGLQALASYTWAHSIDIASSDQQLGTSVLVTNPQLDRGPSNFDVRHAFSGAATYNLPKTKSGFLADQLLAFWSIDAIFTARSATPVNVTYTATIPGLGSFGLRPDLVAGVPLYVSDPNAPGGKRINNALTTVPGNPLPQIGPFLRPTPARQGTLGRNALRGFPLWQWDLAVRRQFSLTEHFNIQFRTEFFNILNHPNFADPNGALSTASTFGVASSMLGRSLGVGGLQGGFNPLYQIGGPRSMQFSLKLVF
jgi:hypothetical protein